MIFKRSPTTLFPISTGVNCTPHTSLEHASSATRMVRRPQRGTQHEQGRAWEEVRQAFGHQRLWNGWIGRLADSASSSFHRQEFTQHHPHQGPLCSRPAKRGTFRTFVQTHLRRIAARLRDEETTGNSLSSDDDQFGVLEPDRIDRGIFRSITFVQTLQTSVW